MASGVDPLSLASDQIFDNNCSLCEEDNVVIEGISYCTACRKYYCQQCLEFHNKFHRDHRDRLLDKTALMDSPPLVSPVGALTTMCGEHHDKLVEMYCHKHDVVCCTVCMAKNHRLCERVDYVPDIVGEFHSIAGISDMKNDLEDIKEALESVRVLRQDDLTRVGKEEQHVLSQVKQLRERMNAAFDKIEETVAMGATSRFQGFSGSIQTDLDVCEEATGDIENMIQELDDTDSNNLAQLFVNVKRATEKVENWRQVSVQVQDHLGQEAINFIIDEDMDVYLTSAKRIGTFVDQLQKSDKLPEVKLLKEAVVRMDGDNSRCMIRGSCCLPGGITLLADFKNGKIKRLNAEYQVTDSCDIKGPNAVCYVQHANEAAVAVGNMLKFIQIVSLGATMTVTRTLQLDNHDCYGVCFHGKLLYVGQNRDKLHSYEYSSGQLRGTADTDNVQKMFSRDLRHIAISRDGDVIYVADCIKGLVLLDKNFSLLSVATDSDLEGAAGVCLDGNGNVLVCGKNSRSIVMFDRQGQKLCTVVSKNGLPADPWSISFDRTRSRLIVTMYDRDDISVFDWI